MDQWNTQSNRMEENISNKSTNRYKSHRACHANLRKPVGNLGLASSPGRKGVQAKQKRRIFAASSLMSSGAWLRFNRNTENHGRLQRTLHREDPEMSWLMQNTRPDPRLQQASGSWERPRSCSLPLCKQVSDQLWPCPCLSSRVSWRKCPDHLCGRYNPEGQYERGKASATSFSWSVSQWKLKIWHC